MKLIMLCLAGSHLYGTNTPESDMDLRGVVLEDEDVIFGLNQFEQLEGKAALNFLTTNYGLTYADDTDIVLYGLKKFMKLAVDGNPNIIELLYAPTLRSSWSWERIIDIREEIISKKALPKFIGYIKSQHGRIKSRLDWLNNPPTKPDPFEYGMERTESGGTVWNSETYHNEYIYVLNDYNNYLRWLRERNPARLELEKKYGYDTKAAMHIYRLISEAVTLSLLGRLVFPAPNLGVLKTVREGGFTLEEVNDFIQMSMTGLSKSNSRRLRDEPDVELVNKTMKTIYTRIYGG